jgi:hypothetical protein
MPWWICNIDVPGAEAKAVHVWIYAYGLRHDFIQLRGYIMADETPFYQTALAWLFIIACAGIVLWSAWNKSTKARMLLAGAGLLYIAYAAIAIFIVVQNRLADFGIALFGWSSNVFGDTVEVAVFHFAALQKGFYLANIAGVMCLVLAVFRNQIGGDYYRCRITGKKATRT